LHSTTLAPHKEVTQGGRLLSAEKLAAQLVEQLDNSKGKQGGDPQGDVEHDTPLERR